MVKKNLSTVRKNAAVVLAVNKTQLHPQGVQPVIEHTEIEEQLHDTAHIDYDRVSIQSNASVAALYEEALVYERGSAITSTGAIATSSGSKTGRSPRDKRIVDEPASSDQIWWGPVNKKISPEVWLINRERAIDYLNTRSRIYVFDGFAGWDPRYRIKVRVVCARAYHCLFMRTMLIRPTQEELAEYGKPDFTIYNAGAFPANRYTTGMTSSTSVAINFADMEMVILGTEYAGEMKKSVFTLMFYLMATKHQHLTLHSSANEGEKGDVSLFFGLSGTGKTTLSADPHRSLIGDDEHVWTDTGVFNVEGGCYAKCIGLTEEKEPEIYRAIKFGSVLENVVFDSTTRVVDYEDISLTENTRCAYPLEYIPNAKIPSLGGHPKNIILLTCDARGVLPPVSKLDTATVQYHFITGYTSKTPGTEEGITEPISTFSACFAQPFLPMHPMVYADMLANKLKTHGTDAWLVNTGWVGRGAVQGGSRCPLKYTRAILDAIHSGALSKAEYVNFPVFNLAIPKACPGVPDKLLDPSRMWEGSAASFHDEIKQLAGLFDENFQKYSDQVTEEVRRAGPKL